MRKKLVCLTSFLIVGMLVGCGSNMKDGSEAQRLNNDQNVTRNVKTDKRDNIYSEAEQFNPTHIRDGARNNKQDYNNPTNLRQDEKRRSDLDKDKRGNVNDNSKFRLADKAADRVTSLEEVDTAVVVITGNNAYVATKLTNDVNTLNNNVKARIADQVKAVDGKIDNVYVSVNPDFFARTNDFAEDLRQGRPVSGFFEEFSEMIDRTFFMDR